jgi:histidinol phosphatase-like PHP family hydrolase
MPAQQVAIRLWRNLRYGARSGPLDYAWSGAGPGRPAAQSAAQSPTRSSIDAAFAAGLDYVIMAASHLYDEGVTRPDKLTAEGTAALCIELMQAAIESGLTDILAHPFGVPESPFTFEEIVAAANQDDWMQVGRAAARAGVAIECNPRYLRRAPDAAHWLFHPLLDIGVKLALSSDAHHPSNVGCQGPQYASEDALRAEGITEDRVWRIEDRVSAGRRTSGEARST